MKENKDSVVFGALFFLLPILLLMASTVITMMPHYTIVLKYLVCFCSIIAIDVILHKKMLKFMIVAWVGVIIFYNPFINFHLARKTWLIADMVTAALFFVGFVKLYLR